MNNSLLIKSLICGISLFAINLLAALAESGQLMMFTVILFPGFIYGLVLVAHNGISNSIIRKIAFWIISGLIYIAVAWVSTDTIFEYPSLQIPLASASGSIALLIAYKYLLVKNINLKRGLPFAFITGIISAILPYIATYMQPESNWIYRLCIFSIFPVWQTTFAWAIQMSTQPKTISRF